MCFCRTAVVKKENKSTSAIYQGWAIWGYVIDDLHKTKVYWRAFQREVTICRRVYDNNFKSERTVSKQWYRENYTLRYIPHGLRYIVKCL